MKILCVGGGPGGLGAAILLALAGHEVTVSERNPEGVTYGWGVMSTQSFDPTRGVDAGTSEAIAAASHPVAGSTIDHPGGRIEWPENQSQSIGRHRLLQVLAERARALGVDVRHSTEVDVATIDEDTEHDLIIISDGVRSQYRTAHAADFGTEMHTGRNPYTWLGTSRVFEGFEFGVVETDAGWLGGHAYPYSSERSTFIVECSPQTWRGLGLDTLGAEASLKLLGELFGAQLHHEPLMLQARDLEADKVPWLHYRRMTNERWHRGKVVLLGDAAHTTHFSIGSGTRLALEDAGVLAQSLERHPDDLEAALTEYASERRAAIQLAQRDATNSQRWLEQLERFATYDAYQFYSLFWWRHSPYLAKSHPGLYFRVRDAVEKNQTLRRAWQRSQKARRSRFLKKHGAAST